MTKENLTSINVLIDKSGSMHGLASDTIGNFNKFLADQKLLPGEAIFTLTTFNGQTNIVHNFISLGSVPELNDTTYSPNGGTALLDALGETINSVGAKLAAMPEEDRPSKVIFLIITDGQENASTDFTRSQVKSMVEHQTQVYSWEFSFYGSSIDQIQSANSLGISSINSNQYTYSSQGMQDLYGSISRSVTVSRSR